MHHTPIGCGCPHHHPFLTKTTKRAISRDVCCALHVGGCHLPPLSSHTRPSSMRLIHEKLIHDPTAPRPPSSAPPCICVSSPSAAGTAGSAACAAHTARNTPGAHTPCTRCCTRPGGTPRTCPRPTSSPRPRLPPPARRPPPPPPRDNGGLTPFLATRACGKPQLKKRGFRRGRG